MALAALWPPARRTAVLTSLALGISLFVFQRSSGSGQLRRGLVNVDLLIGTDPVVRLAEVGGLLFSPSETSAASPSNTAPPVVASSSPASSPPPTASPPPSVSGVAPPSVSSVATSPPSTSPPPSVSSSASPTPLPHTGGDDAAAAAASFTACDLSHARVNWAHCDGDSCPDVDGLLRPPADCAGDAATAWSNLARRCLQDRHVVYVGDSVTRYGYLNLVYWLHTGAWHVPPGQDPNEFNEDRARWNEVLHTTNARLGGKEVCDCHRPFLPDSGYGGANFGAYMDAFVENRYFFDAERNARVSLLGLYGERAVHGHASGPLGVDCQAAHFAAGATARGGGVGGGVGAAAAAATAGTRQPPGCNLTARACLPGACSGPWDWSGPPVGGLLEPLAALAPHAIVLNIGAWDVWTDGDKQAELAAFLRSLRARLPDTRVLWRSTTEKPADPGSPRNENALHLRQERGGLLAMLLKEGVAVFDAPYDVSTQSPVSLWYDNVHPRPPMHSVVNRLVLRELCGLLAPP